VIASHAAGRLTGRAHFDERHSDAPSGEVHCQCKSDGTAPDDQDLGVDQMRHGATRLSGAEGLPATKDTCHVLSIQLVTRVTLQNIIVVIKIVRSGQIARRARLRSLWPRNAQICKAGRRLA
jgi:hypothetical protein